MNLITSERSLSVSVNIKGVLGFASVFQFCFIQQEYQWCPLVMGVRKKERGWGLHTLEVCLWATPRLNSWQGHFFLFLGAIRVASILRCWDFQLSVCTYFTCWNYLNTLGICSQCIASILDGIFSPQIMVCMNIPLYPHEFSDPAPALSHTNYIGGRRPIALNIRSRGAPFVTSTICIEFSWLLSNSSSCSGFNTASLSHFRTMLPESSSRPNHTT